MDAPVEVTAKIALRGTDAGFYYEDGHLAKMSVRNILGRRGLVELEFHEKSYIVDATSLEKAIEACRRGER